MIQTQLKLKLTIAQEKSLNAWLWHLTGVWNWAIRKIELDAKDRIYHGKFAFANLLAGHSGRLGIPSHVLQGVLREAHTAWSRCFKKISGRPRLKGERRKLNSILFQDPLKAPDGCTVKLLGLGNLKFHKQEIPKGKIKCSRIIKRSSGWYLCLFIDAARQPIDRMETAEIGIDPGFKSLLVFSSGEIIDHPKELQAIESRISQAQRAKSKRLLPRLYERRANRVKDRNHKLSLRLVQDNRFIAFSADSHQKIARRFGKSVASSAHYQLRQMIQYKSLIGGTEYVETDSKFSTKTCSTCGSLSGPTGLAGLKVRRWHCSHCGSEHDRDVNAARNVLIVGAGLALRNRNLLTEMVMVGGERNQKRGSHD